MKKKPYQPPKEAKPCVRLMGGDSRHGAHDRGRGAAEGIGDSLSDVAGHLGGI